MGQNRPAYRPMQDTRGAGRLRVLNAIRQSGQIARIDISKMTGLSPATVTAITAQLLQAGLIQRTATDDKTPGQKRGRPREALMLRAGARLIAGLKVADRAIVVLLVDFVGNEVGQKTVSLPRLQFSPEALCDRIIKALALTCQASGYAMHQLSGICVGLAGQIDGSTGFVHWSSSLTVRNVALGDLLAVHAPCPVFIENDANLVATAEQRFGLGRGVGTFLVVTVAYGIGMGIVIDDTLYRGARGCGAEFGHTKVTSGGALCQCGQRGCLEAYAGAYALASADAQTREKAMHYFAVSLANLVNIFDPELLILASEQGPAHPLCAPSVLDEIKRTTMQLDLPKPRIVPHGWGDLMWAKGAAAYGIDRIAAISLRDLTEDDTPNQKLRTE